MNEANRYMSEILRIINGALRLDIDRVRNYAAFLAEKMDKDGDARTASRLRKLLAETDHQLRPAGAAATAARAVPVDSESRFPLVERVELRGLEEPSLVLDEETWTIVREFISVAKSHGQIESHGVSTAHSMLMFGPPGTGKSRLARHIARELALPLYMARLDGLVSSFLGSTSKNIRALFDFAAKTPCALFLDEFDAIAKLRADTQELGELKRVVNSFIQNLDSVGQQAIILAATNHEELLDNAVWRRFTYRIKLTYPTVEARRQLWTGQMPSTPKRKKDLEALIDLSEGFSGAEIHEVCQRLKRKEIIEKQKAGLDAAFLALQNVAVGEGESRCGAITSLKGLSRSEIAQRLRQRNPKLYSTETVARLLGVSKPTAHRWMTAGRIEDA